MAVHRAMRSCRFADDLYLKAKYIATTEKYSLQGTTQGNGLTGGVPPVRFSM